MGTAPTDPPRPAADPDLLDQQVKQLVQVEQRLYRTQNELGRELQNMRDLGEFALACSGADDVPAILRRALEVLGAAFTLDWVAALELDPDAGTAELVTADPPAFSPAVQRLEPDELAWLGGCPVFERVALDAEPGAGRLRAFLRRWWPAELEPPGERAGHVVFVTLRGGASAPRAVLVAYAAERRRAFSWPSDLSERDLPFLRLFADHLERAFENSALTSDLRERTLALGASLDALERAQTELVQAHKLEAIGRLAGGVAHDFNNILTVILGTTRLMRESLDAGSSHAAGLERVITAGERAASITRQLLAFGRRQVQHRQAVDLNRLTAAMTDMLARLIGEHVRLVLDPAPGLPPVWADPSQLEQVLLNLVVNARDAMPEGGEVRVVTRRATAADAARCESAIDPERYVVLEVSDDGVGMDESVRAHLFEPFYSTKEVGRGTGLGLAVVYGVVRQSEGRILVDSAPGRGACLTVLLPWCEAGAAGSEGPVADTRPAARHAATVMVVEDEAMIRRIACEFLERSGFEVVEMADGIAALEWLGADGRHVDVVLSDVVMPRMGGVRLAEELARRRPGLPLVFMSGYSREHAVGSAATGAGDGGAVAYVMKPFTREALVGAVAAALAPMRRAA